MLVNAFKGVLLLSSVMVLTACKNGGNVTLAPGASKVTNPGSPFVQVNQGGKALVVEQGMTPTTGVHGWVAIQNVAAKSITDPKSGNNIVLNKNAAFH